MTQLSPEEKGKELVERFYPLVHKGDSTVSPDELAKQCAIICVDEILKTYNSSDEIYMAQNGLDIQYFLSVKKAIENL